jgi:hypothetical protein
MLDIPEVREAAGCSHLIGGIELTGQGIQAENSIVERFVIPARGHILDKQTREDKGTYSAQALFTEFPVV